MEKEKKSPRQMGKTKLPRQLKDETEYHRKGVRNHSNNQMKFHFTPIKLAKMCKSGNINCWQDDRVNGMVTHYWWE